MLTNFGTIRRAIKKMGAIDRMQTDGTFDNISKRERLQITRQREKLEKNLGSIQDLTRLPSALFIVDIVKEHIAVAEARKLNIPTFAMVDTNSDPTLVDYPIPANDDASKSIEKIIDIMVAAINEGLDERKSDKAKAATEAKAEKKEAAPAEAAEATPVEAAAPAAEATAESNEKPAGEEAGE